MIRPLEFKQSGYVLLLLICFTIIACSDKDIDRINDTSNAAEVNPESNTHESLIESDTGFDSNAETTISDEVIKTKFIEIDNITSPSDFIKLRAETDSSALKKKFCTELNIEE